MRALLVDDEDAILCMMKTVLQMHGFETSTAASATEAEKELQKRAFDIVITDLRMETPTAGFDVVRAAAQLTPKPVIVILTAFPVPASQWKPLGADALFQKGSSTVQLVERLKALVGFKAKTKTGAARI